MPASYSTVVLDDDVHLVIMERHSGCYLYPFENPSRNHLKAGFVQPPPLHGMKLIGVFLIHAEIPIETQRAADPHVWQSDW